MTIYKYHYAATIAVGFDNGDGFKVECSGDGYSTVPHHEIQSAIETHTSMLDDEFPNGAVNVGLHYGITRSEIGQPQPMPPGEYVCSVAGVKENPDGSFTMSFDAGGQTLKTRVPVSDDHAAVRDEVRAAVDISDIYNVAHQMASVTGVPYERCLALVVNMVAVEKAHRG